LFALAFETLIFQLLLFLFFFNSLTLLSRLAFNPLLLTGLLLCEALFLLRLLAELLLHLALALLLLALLLQGLFFLLFGPDAFLLLRQSFIFFFLAFEVDHAFLFFLFMMTDLLFRGLGL
jgi:hypothetical protein